MCRWFTYLGHEPQLLEDVLLRPTHSIVKQIDEHFLPPDHTSFDPSKVITTQTNRYLTPSSANDSGSPNPLTNMDGFGICWWSDAFEEYDSQAKDDLRPVVYKNTRPPLNDLVLRSLARGVQTKAVVAHIRAGTGLTPVVETNCHPFTFGRYVFCHNGVLGSFHLFKTRILSLLPLRYQVAILGTTDSEHIAALYFYYLCGEEGDWEQLAETKDMALAMRKTLDKLEELKKEAEGSGKIEHNALNLLVNSGTSAVAIRYASPAGHEAPSLYYSTSAGADLNRKFKGHPDQGKPNAEISEGERAKEEHGKHVIIASEPTTFKSEDWELIQAGNMVVVDPELGLKFEEL